MCLCVCVGSCMMVFANLNLMICTTLICNTVMFWGDDSIEFPGSEFLREIATLRDEARVRGDPEKLLGQGSLDTFGASEAL